eukprot:6181718-Pleurochrysis_carterae.AAC.1
MELGPARKQGARQGQIPAHAEKGMHVKSCPSIAELSTHVKMNARIGCACVSPPARRPRATDAAAPRQTRTQRSAASNPCPDARRRKGRRHVHSGRNGCAEEGAAEVSLPLAERGDRGQAEGKTPSRRRARVGRMAQKSRRTEKGARTLSRGEQD